MRHQPHRQRGLAVVDQLALAAVVLVTATLAFLCGAWVGAVRERGHAQAAQRAMVAGAKAQATALDGGRRGLQTTLGEALANIDTHLQTEQTHAKTENTAYQRGVRAGTVRVSVPVVPATCGPTGGAAEHAGPGPEQARAQLEPAAAADLDAIAGDGDGAIRDLNACIDKYAAVKRTMDAWAETLSAAAHAQAR